MGAITVEIRREQPDDIPVIHQITHDAFAPKAFSDGTEPAVIDALREAGDLALSLVAVKDDIPVGHVAFSPVEAGNVSTGWFGLGPVAVLPDLQRTGIGSALIKKGLNILRETDARGCALIGDPGYYCRFGFTSDGCLHYEGVPDKNVMWLSFDKCKPTGQLIFKPAFRS